MSDRAQAGLVLGIAFGVFVGVGAGWTLWGAELGLSEWLKAPTVIGLVLIGISGVGAVRGLRR